ncbi:MAG: class I SAM-dependent methyltransferase [Phycisphaerae bacterium]|nr:class I SAM-dependent methyltransferase [Phycisphaerae bacterium]
MVPCQNESNGRKKGYWTASWLTNALETSVQYHPEEAAAILSAPAKPRRRNSILQWYVQEAHLLWGQLQSLKTMDFNTRVVKGEYPFLRNAVNRVVSKPNSRFLEILEEESTYRNWMNYCIDGVYYKSALLQHMLERFFQTRQDLFVADMGAGPGYLAAELALCDERVREVLVNDSNGINLLFAKRFLAFFGEDFASRFSMNISPMEECRYERMYDVICFIGSLLYLPRDMAGITLDRAWDALLPGGILVVHENIKRDSYSRDYHLMFTTGELDDALARFGRILYFSSTAMMEVAPSRAGTSTVFRVVQKET